MCFEILTGFCAKLLYSRRITDHFLGGREKEIPKCSEKILNSFQGTKYLQISLHHSVLSFCVASTCETAFSQS